MRDAASPQLHLRAWNSGKPSLQPASRGTTPFAPCSSRRAGAGQQSGNARCENRSRSRRSPLFLRLASLRRRRDRDRGDGSARRQRKQWSSAFRPVNAQPRIVLCGYSSADRRPPRLRGVHLVTAIVAILSASRRASARPARPRRPSQASGGTLRRPACSSWPTGTSCRQAAPAVGRPPATALGHDTAPEAGSIGRFANVGPHARTRAISPSSATIFPRTGVRTSRVRAYVRLDFPPISPESDQPRRVRRG